MVSAKFQIIPSSSLSDGQIHIKQAPQTSLVPQYYKKENKKCKISNAKCKIQNTKFKPSLAAAWTMTSSILSELPPWLSLARVANCLSSRDNTRPTKSWENLKLKTFLVALWCRNQRVRMNRTELDFSAVQRNIIK